jgi:hypothetical protein
MMRRLLTFLTVAVATAAGTTWWLYDGDLAAAVEPLAQTAWDADALAVEAGIAAPPPADP